MPKATTPTALRQARRHNPLEDDIVATGVLKTKSGKRRSKADPDEEHYVDPRASKKILQIGRELAEEDAAERSAGAGHPTTVDAFGYDSRFPDEEEADNVYDDDEAWGDENDEEVEEIEVDPEDLEMYQKFMPNEEDDLLKHGWDRKPSGDEDVEQPTNLADLILAKIAAHESKAASGGDMRAPDDDYELPPKVIEVYTKLVKSFHP